MLHFTRVQMLHFFSFNKLKVCGSPAWSKSVGAFCPMTFAHFVSLCHIWAILTIFRTFSLYLLQWSVISDVPIIIALGCHKHCPYKMASLIHPHCVCSDCSPDQLLCFLSSSPWTPSPIPWDTALLKLGYLIILQWPVSVPVKGRVAHLSF